MGLKESTERYLRGERKIHKIIPQNFRNKASSIEEVKIKAYTQPIIQQLIVEHYKNRVRFNSWE